MARGKAKKTGSQTGTQTGTLMEAVRLFWRAGH